MKSAWTRARLIASSSLLVPILLTGAVRAAPATTLKVVTELDHTEPFEGMTSHAGLLWVGSSRQEFSSLYRLRIFTPAGEPVKELELPHALSYIYPYDQDSVLVVGTSATPNVTQFTIVRRRGADFEVRSRRIPEHAWAYQWIGHADREYFIDFSGNTDDPQRDEDPNLASQTIFKVERSGTTRYMPTRVRAPIGGKLIGNELFIVHRQAIGQPHSNAVRVNLQSAEAKPIFDSFRNELTDLAHLSSQNLVAFAEAGAQLVLLYDPAAGSVRHVVPVPGRPRTLANFGRCLAVGSEHDKIAHIIDVDSATPRIVGSYSFEKAGDKFMGLRKLTTDIATGTLYGRSNYPCAPLVECPEERNSVVALTLNSDDPALSVCR